MKARNIIQHIPKVADYIRKDFEILNVAPISDLKTNCLSFYNGDNIKDYEKNISNENLIVVNEKITEQVLKLEKGNFIFSKDPRIFFAKLVNFLIYNNHIKIEEVFKVGDNFFSDNTCDLKNCIIGDNVIIHSGTSIGKDGFGYVKIEDKFIKFPHIGKVIIEDDVEIHSNVVIDRGSLSDTIIRKGTKINSGVCIGHNVEIGKNNLIGLQSTISGGSKIGNDCWLSPGSRITNGITIVNNTMIGIGSVVIRSILNEGETWVGNPARKLR